MAKYSNAFNAFNASMYAAILQNWALRHITLSTIATGIAWIAPSKARPCPKLPKCSEALRFSISLRGNLL